jgi:hypothetical protein
MDIRPSPHLAPRIGGIDTDRYAEGKGLAVSESTGTETMRGAEGIGAA